MSTPPALSAWRPRRRPLQFACAVACGLALAALAWDLQALRERQGWNARIAALVQTPAGVGGGPLAAGTARVATSVAAASGASVGSVGSVGSARSAGSGSSASPVAIDPIGSGTPAAWRLAESLALVRAGRDDEALARLASLQADPDLAAVARFNAGNLLLRQALVLREGPAPGLALPALEGAKAAYRDVLRRNPDDWDARYNLDRALRLAPDAEADDEPAAMRVGAERAATTMRGVSPGLP